MFTTFKDSKLNEEPKYSFLNLMEIVCGTLCRKSNKISRRHLNRKERLASQLLLLTYPDFSRLLTSEDYLTSLSSALTKFKNQLLKIDYKIIILMEIKRTNWKLAEGIRMIYATARLVKVITLSKRCLI